MKIENHSHIKKLSYREV